MRILLIGGAGYVGTALAARLRRDGHDILVVDPLWFGNNLEEGVELIPVSSFHLTERDFSGFDVVVYLGGLSNDAMADFDPARNFAYNAAAVSHAAFLAKRSGVRRFVYASSCSVYGATGRACCDEDSPLDLSSAYAASKVFGERALLALEDGTFSVVILRKGTVCGYAPRMRLDLLLNTMVAAALTTGTVVVNDPAAWRPLLGLDDAVDAYLCSVRAPATVSGVFNIASLNVSVLHAATTVAELVAEFTGQPVSIEVLGRTDPRSYAVDWARAGRVLKFAPGATIASTVSDLIAHFPEYANVHDPRYRNIDSLKLSLGELVPHPFAMDAFA